MAFGFLIERFDLIRKETAPLSDTATLHRTDYDVANIAGVSSIVIGTTMCLLATLRFLRTMGRINVEVEVKTTGYRLDVALAELLSLMGISLFLYLRHL